MICRSSRKKFNAAQCILTAAMFWMATGGAFAQEIDTCQTSVGGVYLNDTKPSLLSRGMQVHSVGAHSLQVVGLAGLRFEDEKVSGVTAPTAIFNGVNLEASLSENRLRAKIGVPDEVNLDAKDERVLVYAQGNAIFYALLEKEGVGGWVVHHYALTSRQAWLDSLPRSTSHYQID